jgi:hypothetical protein
VAAGVAALLSGQNGVVVCDPGAAAGQSVREIASRRSGAPTAPRCAGRPTPARSPRDRGDRHGEHGPDDAAQHGAGGQGDEDHEGVQLHGASHQHRLQQVALQLVDEHDDAHHEQGHDPAVRDERDQRGEDAGEGRADDRDEREQEHQHRQRQGQRHLQDQQPDEDADGIHRGDGRRAAHVRAEHGHRLVADPQRPLVGLAAERPQQEAHICGPSLRKKKSITIISTRPVMKFARR